MEGGDDSFAELSLNNVTNNFINAKDMSTDKSNLIKVQPYQEMTIPSQKVASLAERLGSLPSDEEYPAGAFQFSRDLLSSLKLGDLDGQLDRFSKEVEQVNLSCKKVQRIISSTENNSKACEESFFQLYQFVSDRETKSKIPMIHPSVIDATIHRIEREKDFFPGNTLMALLKLKCISDVSHPLLIERILETKSLELIFSFVENVTDMREETLVKILQCFFLDEDHFKVEPLPGFSVQDSLILSLMEWKFENYSMVAALKELEMRQVVILLNLLVRLFDIFSRVHAERLLLKEETKPDNTIKMMRFPSRANTLKWLEVLIDSHYPELLSEPVIIENVKELRKVISAECDSTDLLLEAGTFITSVAYVAKKLGKGFARGFADNAVATHDPIYKDYIVEYAKF